MTLSNTIFGWGLVARVLHWTMALVILGMLVLGTIMVDWPDAELQTKFALYQWHKSFGFLVLALVVLRSLWRWTQPTPALPPATSRTIRRASALSHGALYALMFLMPLTGYVMSSANTLGVPTVIFGVIEVPHLVPANATVEAVFKTTHEWLAAALILVVTIHVLAALKHALLNRDGVFTRMVAGPESVGSVEPERARA